MSENKFYYDINRDSERVFKKDGTAIKLSDPFLAAREVSREGGIDNFINKHYEERRHHEWRQEDPYNNLTLEEIREFKKIEEAEQSEECNSIFDRK